MIAVLILVVGLVLVKYTQLSLKEEKALHNRIVKLRAENSELRRQLDTANHKLKVRK